MEPTAEDKAKAVIDTAADAAKALIETATIPPWMHDHIADEAEKQRKMGETIATLATKEDLKKLDSSIRELKHLQRNFLQGVLIAKNGGKWTYRAILVIAGLVGAIGIILGGWKAILAFFITPK